MAGCFCSTPLAVRLPAGALGYIRRRRLFVGSIGGRGGGGRGENAQQCGPNRPQRARMRRSRIIVGPGGSRLRMLAHIRALWAHSFGRQPFGLRADLSEFAPRRQKDSGRTPGRLPAAAAPPFAVPPHLLEAVLAPSPIAAPTPRAPRARARLSAPFMSVGTAGFAKTKVGTCANVGPSHYTRHPRHSTGANDRGRSNGAGMSDIEEGWAASCPPSGGNLCQL